MARGEISTGRKRNSHPQDWCVDESWVAWQLFEALGRFEQERVAGEVIWDPCAGSGRTMVTFADEGFKVFLSDIVDRVERALFGENSDIAFFRADFLEETAARSARPCSIVCNPPYSYIEGIAEAFVRQALRIATRRVCMVLPIKWQGSQTRFDLFDQDHPPQAILVLTQRPSMPPGDMIPALEAEGKAFRGGVVDYAWYVWNVQQPTRRHQTRIIWLPPLNRPDMLGPIEGLA
ncbi:MAG: class I SAM-dependent methyltransferase [Sphingomonadales bacterium]|nr:class I SAM-dependent methyltransferase [Sphingomonadales bacterium]MBD3772086.1 class I SAM-dependent methyltransferase [Paracoccaceae bacterium]